LIDPAAQGRPLAAEQGGSRAALAGRIQNIREAAKGVVVSISRHAIRPFPYFSRFRRCFT